MAHIEYYRNLQQPRRTWLLFSLCRHLSIFPGRHQPSIFDVYELNFCVRNGNRWSLIAINTDYCEPCSGTAVSLVTRGRIELPMPPWEGGVLTAWPTGHLVHHHGLEPGTHWLRVSCSTNWAKGAFLMTLLDFYRYVGSLTRPVTSLLSKPLRLEGI